VKPEEYVTPLLRKIWKGVFAVNTDYDSVKGQAAIDAGDADLIIIGRPFIANPDLIHRVSVCFYCLYFLYLLFLFAVQAQSSSCSTRLQSIVLR
jgi:hypothetical protein